MAIINWDEQSIADCVEAAQPGSSQAYPTNGATGATTKTAKNSLTEESVAGQATATPTAAPGSTVPTSTNQQVYSERIGKLLTDHGWSFRMNALDDSIEVNGEKLTDPTESQIKLCVKDHGDKGDTGTSLVPDVIRSMAATNTYHPLKEYFEGLRWDGGDHIALLASFFYDKHEKIDYGNGETTEVFHAFLRKWLLGAVAKIYTFGALKAQNPMLVLSGGQGLGKSTFVRWLSGEMLAYSIESDVRPEENDHKRYLASKWIWEVGELGATTRKADIEALKQFLTMQDVTFRVPYDRYSIKKPSIASFIGTVNPDGTGFLADATGNRRFMTVELKSIDHDYQGLVDVNQVWAQAYELFQAGESWLLNDTEKAKAAEINGENTKRDPIEDYIMKLFDINEKETWAMDVPAIMDILQNAGVKTELKTLQMSVSKVLQAEGLRKDIHARPRKWIGIRQKFNGNITP